MDDIALDVSVLSSLGDIAAAEWDSCACPEAAAGRPRDPFTTHRFLAALERSGSVGPGTGWHPRHLIARAAGEVIAAMPLYVKSHSQGEYIFDHAWADSYERAGGRYYPKLQSAVPFTPATGRRFLTKPGWEATGRAALTQGLVQIASDNGLSSAHITFCTGDEAEAGVGMGLLHRVTQQFHWENRSYADFDAFLADLASRKRKTIRKERAGAAGFGGRIRHLTGDAIRPDHWDAFWTFYQETGSRKWGRPYLTRGFFDEVQATMRDDVLLILARTRRPAGRRRAQLHRARHALRPLLGRGRGPPVPAFRMLLLPGHRLRHRPRPVPGRGRRAGRAQARPGLPSVRDPFAALDRRAVLPNRRRPLPGRGIPRRRRGNRGAHRLRPVPQIARLLTRIVSPCRKYLRRRH